MLAPTRCGRATTTAMVLGAAVPSWNVGRVKDPATALRPVRVNRDAMATAIPNFTGSSKSLKSLVDGISVTPERKVVN